MTTPSIAALAVAIAAIYMHGICQHFTGGVPRLPRWQPAHATGEVLTNVVQGYGCNGHG